MFLMVPFNYIIIIKQDDNTGYRWHSFNLHRLVRVFYNSNISWRVDATFSDVFFFKWPILFINLALSAVLI